MYDIFYLKSSVDNFKHKEFKKKYPFSKVIEHDGLIQEAVAKAAAKSFTNMFWLIDNDCEIEGTLEFKVPDHDLIYVHGNIYLIPKKHSLTDDDINYLFNRPKEYPSKISELRPVGTYDIFFISYDEPNADYNWKELTRRFPSAKRIHGVKGIHQAHKEAARQSTTESFWVVDGDSLIVDSFDFSFRIPFNNQDRVYVWRSRNPVNGLEYGYGGVKLLPKRKTLSIENTTVDMTTSISDKVISMEEVSNYTMFNTDPFNAWKSAFRECVKLSSKVISNQVDTDTENRLEIWCTVGEDKPFGNYALWGAGLGKAYGSLHSKDKEALRRINDWEWLDNVFKRTS
jgi:hypothetical protein